MAKNIDEREPSDGTVPATSYELQLVMYFYVCQADTEQTTLLRMWAESGLSNYDWLESYWLSGPTV